MDEIEGDLEIGLEIYLAFFTDWYYKNWRLIAWSVKKRYWEYWSKNFKTKNNRLIRQSKCSVSKNKKSRFVKEQDAKGLLSNLGIKIPLSKFLCWMVCFKCKNEQNY